MFAEFLALHAPAHAGRPVASRLGSRSSNTRDLSVVDLKGPDKVAIKQQLVVARVLIITHGFSHIVQMGKIASVDDTVYAAMSPSIRLAVDGEESTLWGWLVVCSAPDPGKPEAPSYPMVLACEQYRDCGTRAWHSLQDYYNPSTQAELQSVMSDYHNIVMDDGKSLAEHLSTLEVLYQRIVAIKPSAAPQEDARVYHALQTLPPAYVSLGQQLSIIGRTEPVTWALFCKEALALDSMLKSAKRIELRSAQSDSLALFAGSSSASRSRFTDAEWEEYQALKLRSAPAPKYPGKDGRRTSDKDDSKSAGKKHPCFNCGSWKHAVSECKEDSVTCKECGTANHQTRFHSFFANLKKLNYVIISIPRSPHDKRCPTGYLRR
jgi:hypothetical protein